MYPIEIFKMEGRNTITSLHVCNMLIMLEYVTSRLSSSMPDLHVPNAE